MDVNEVLSLQRGDEVVLDLLAMWKEKYGAASGECRLDVEGWISEVDPTTCPGALPQHMADQGATIMLATELGAAAFDCDVCEVEEIDEGEEVAILWDNNGEEFGLSFEEMEFVHKKG